MEITRSLINPQKILTQSLSNLLNSIKLWPNIQVISSNFKYLLEKLPWTKQETKIKTNKKNKQFVPLYEVCPQCQQGVVTLCRVKSNNWLQSASCDTLFLKGNYPPTVLDMSVHVVSKECPLTNVTDSGCKSKNLCHYWPCWLQS